MIFIRWTDSWNQNQDQEIEHYQIPQSDPQDYFQVLSPDITTIPTLITINFAYCELSVREADSSTLLCLASFPQNDVWVSLAGAWEKNMFIFIFVQCLPVCIYRNFLFICISYLLLCTRPPQNSKALNKYTFIVVYRAARGFFCLLLCSLNSCVTSMGCVGSS